ncbi:hypothetical protein [Aquamicrobium sp. LC103]|uniref:hypothetical protein n=1 Tax=Aquamicrobium sp. LC103 TaxID=1120658 RepID=UPI00063EBD69|nr:hypothetical protein [Aquamicrobium sp. LC103]TKT69379.1 hypothetical protein XW59_028020 [Aquamicrobium sp. LC103]
MNIVELILTICLSGNPGQCREQHIQFEDSGSLTSCMFQAPTYIAKWSEEHPAVRVVRWKCAYPEKSREI